MKKISILFIIALMVVYMIPVALADSPISELVYKQTINNAREKQNVEKAITDSNNQEFLAQNKDIMGRNELKVIEKPEDVQYGTPYKVIIANKDVITTMLSGEPISNALLNAPYYWEAPILVGSTESKIVAASMTIDKLNDKWQVVETGGYLSPQLIDFSSNYGKIIAIIQGNGINEASSILHFRIPSLHSDFIYIADNNNEKFIPLFHNRETLYGLSNLKVYSQDEIINAIGPVLKEGLKYQPNEGPVSGIVGDSQEHTANISLVLLIMGLMFSLGLITYYHRVVKINAK